MSKSLRPAFPILLCSALAGTLLLLSSCGGGSSSTSVKSITVMPSSSSVGVNGQQVFTAAAVDANGNAVGGLTFTWASSNIDVAPIDSSSGLATGKSGGTTQITATASNMTSPPATLTVLPAILSVSISPISASIKVGQKQQFVATAKDVNGNAVSGTPFSWSNSFSGIVTIDNNGLATGLSPGTVLITATLGGVTSPVATLNVTP